MDLCFALARGREQLDCDPADDERGPGIRLGQTHGLFIEGLLAGIVPDPATRALGVSHDIRPVLAHHKKRALPRQTKQNPQRANLAIRHNTVSLRYHRDDLGQQGALLCIGVFTRNDIGDHRPLRIIEDQGMSRQRGCPIPAECFHPMLRSGHPLEEIAATAEITVGTVVSHLLDLMQDEPIASIDGWLPLELQQRILGAADRVGREKLKPIFEELQQTVSYEQIRLMLSFEKQQS